MFSISFFSTSKIFSPFEPKIGQWLESWFVPRNEFMLTPLHLSKTLFCFAGMFWCRQGCHVIFVSPWVTQFQVMINLVNGKNRQGAAPGGELCHDSLFVLSLTPAPGCQCKQEIAGELPLHLDQLMQFESNLFINWHNFDSKWVMKWLQSCNVQVRVCPSQVLRETQSTLIERRYKKLMLKSS